MTFRKPTLLFAMIGLALSLSVNAPGGFAFAAEGAAEGKVGGGGGQETEGGGGKATGGGGGKSQ